MAQAESEYNTRILNLISSQLNGELALRKFYEAKLKEARLKLTE